MPAIPEPIEDAVGQRAEVVAALPRRRTDIFMAELEVTKVRCLVSRGGSMMGMHNLDMIDFAGDNYIVFQWEKKEDGSRRPLYMAPIDKRFLQALAEGENDEAAYQYRMSVEDPRPQM